MSAYQLPKMRRKLRAKRSDFGFYKSQESNNETYSTKPSANKGAEFDGKELSFKISNKTFSPKDDSPYLYPNIDIKERVLNLG